MPMRNVFLVLLAIACNAALDGAIDTADAAVDAPGWTPYTCKPAGVGQWTVDVGMDFPLTPMIAFVGQESWLAADFIQYAAPDGQVTVRSDYGGTDCTLFVWE